WMDRTFVLRSAVLSEDQLFDLGLVGRTLVLPWEPHVRRDLLAVRRLDRPRLLPGHEDHVPAVRKQCRDGIVIRRFRIIRRSHDGRLHLLSTEPRRRGTR